MVVTNIQANDLLFERVKNPRKKKASISYIIILAVQRLKQEYETCQHGT